MLFERSDFKGRSQILYNAVVDEQINGFNNLHKSYVGNDKVSSMKPLKGKLPFSDIFFHLLTEKCRILKKINMFIKFIDKFKFKIKVVIYGYFHILIKKEEASFAKIQVVAI